MRRACGLSVLAVVLAGCATAMPEPEMVGGQGREAAWDVEMSYLAATRAMLVELRQRFGLNPILHDIWPDIQEADIRVATVRRDGLLLSINAKARSPDRCRVTLRCSHSQWMPDLQARMEKALKVADHGDTPAKR